MLQKILILIAEDDPDDRFLLELAFREKGYTEQVVFVENGLELFDFLSANEDRNGLKETYPYFILLDLDMPKKDGREVLLEIKQHPRYRRIPILVFSTTKNESVIRRCYDLGANTYIVKPSDYNGILKVLEDIRNYWMNAATIPPLL